MRTAILLLSKVLTRSQQMLIAATLVLSLLSAAFEGLGIGLLIPLIGIVSGDPALSSRMYPGLRYFQSGDTEQIRVITLTSAIFGLILLKNITSYANSLLSAYMYGVVGHHVRSEIAQRLLSLDVNFFLRHGRGRILNVFSNESWRASDAVATLIALLVSSSAVLVLICFLVSVSWQMTLFVTVFIILFQVIHSRSAETLILKSRDLSGLNASLASKMLQIVQSSKLIRVFEQQTREQMEFDSVSDNVRKAAFTLHARQNLIHPINEVSFACLLICIMALAYRFDLGFPTALGFLVLLYRLHPYARSAQAAGTQLQAWAGSIEEVSWLLGQVPPALVKKPKVARFPKHIEFEDVTFAYGVDSDARGAQLKNVSFQIQAGSSVALVGRSGAGKTTIINLLCGMYSPSAGQLLLDRTSLVALDLSSWRSYVGLASNDLELLSGTVLENILYGSPTKTRDDAMRAASQVEAHQFITDLPFGYDTLLGEGGGVLSAGQRQRIALARALVRDPDLLILDEATSAVDGISEDVILDMIRNRRGRKTTIVVSHDRGTISCCDHIILMRDGRVAGTVSGAEAENLNMHDLYLMNSESSGRR